MIGRIAIKSCRPEAGQSLAVHGAEADDANAAEALQIKVCKVKVFDDEPVTNQETSVMPFVQVVRPSRAFPGSISERTETNEDGVPTSIKRCMTATAMPSSVERSNSATALSP